MPGFLSLDRYIVLYLFGGPVTRAFATSWWLGIVIYKIDELVTSGSCLTCGVSMLSCFSFVSPAPVTGFLCTFCLPFPFRCQKVLIIRSFSFDALQEHKSAFSHPFSIFATSSPTAFEVPHFHFRLCFSFLLRLMIH